MWLWSACCQFSFQNPFYNLITHWPLDWNLLPACIIDKRRVIGAIVSVCVRVCLFIILAWTTFRLNTCLCWCKHLLPFNPKYAAMLSAHEGRILVQLICLLVIRWNVVVSIQWRTVGRVDLIKNLTEKLSAHNVSYRIDIFRICFIT